MQIILYHKHYNPQHLEEIKTKMLKLGAPVIRAVWSEAYGMWLATEGCHRIRAAKALGLTPIIKDVSSQKSVTIQTRDGNIRFNSQAALTEHLQDHINQADYITFD